MSQGNWRGRRPEQFNTGFVGPSSDRQAVEDLFEAVEMDAEPQPDVVEVEEEEEPNPAPARPNKTLKGEKTWLTGAQIKSFLVQMGIADRKFSRDGGLNEKNAKRILQGKSDGDIPKLVELLLRTYMTDPATRHPTREINLPFEEYGLKLLMPGME